MAVDFVRPGLEGSRGADLEHHRPRWCGRMPERTALETLEGVLKRLVEEFKSGFERGCEHWSFFNT